MTSTLSRKAEEDLIGIWLDGNDRFGPQEADAYQDSLAATFDPLSGHPELARERTELVLPLRVYPSGSHFVLSQLRADGKIFVARIRHQREDWVSYPL